MVFAGGFGVRQLVGALRQEAHPGYDILVSPFQGLSAFLRRTQGVALGWHVSAPLVLLSRQTGNVYDRL